MPTPQQELEAIVRRAATAVLGEATPVGSLVRPCPRPEHGDYQTNVAMVAAKPARRNPRELAGEIIAELSRAGDPPFAEPELAGPGFINFRLRPAYVAAQIAARQGAPRLGVEPAAETRTLVLDFSAPNVAKEMHVGHLRSTILGDSLQRLFKFLGHRVTSDNHIGDWGTQFGMVILGWKREGDEAELARDPFGHLESVYRRVQAAAEEDETVREAARAELKKLQAGDAENLALWRRFIELSLQAANGIYGRLGVHFDTAHGESFYNDALPDVVEELVAAGVARESEGAIAVFSDGSLPPKDDPLLVAEKKAESGFRPNPFLIRKSDGAFLYATTDLATLQFRLREYAPGEIIYVTDGRQQMHFAQLFETARQWGVAREVHLVHAWFGTILGPDKKPFKTREGTAIKLKALLDEAAERARAIVDEKRPDLPEAERAQLAETIGLGALKYADLAQNRNLDYVFDWEKLLALKGNTAPYLQNAYVRTRAIFRKAEIDPEAFTTAEIELAEDAELTLSKKLLALGDVLALAAAECRPHYLCNYLFELADQYHKFYEACPVLSAPSEGLKLSRLALCRLTGETLRTGLSLLGIGTAEQM